MTFRYALLLLCLGLMAPAAGAPDVNAGRLKNSLLEVTIRGDGSFDVRDLRNGRCYLQGADERAETPVPQAPAAFVADGDLGEWQGVPGREIATVTEGKPECRATLYLGWGAAGALCVGVRVRDRLLDFGPAANPWEQDSVELWLGDSQLNLTLQGGRPLLRRMKGAGGNPDWRVGLRATADGYAAELAVTGLKEGAPVDLAVALNDVNGGATREGQLSWPAGYQHGNVATEVRLSRPDGKKPAPRLRQGANSVEVDLLLGGIEATARFRLDRDRLIVEVTGEPGQAMPGGFAYPRPIGFDAPKGCWVMPHKSGLAYPVRGDTLRMNTHEPSMPLFAAVDPDGGGGVLAVLDTPFDAELVDARAGGLRSIAVRWLPSLGKLGYTRRITYHFLPRGTLMQAAERYREVALASGKWAGFAQRVKTHPQVERFIASGAEFYGNVPQFAALYEMGVTGLLAEGGTRKEAAYGFVPSRYDIYTDVYDPAGAAEWGAGHPSTWERNIGFRFPQDIVKRKDGSPRVGGPVIDNPRIGKKALCYRPNQRVALDVLKREDRGTGYVRNLGLEALFLDVTTAEQLFEDYDAAHPCSREEDARYRRAQFEYLRGVGVLAGSEAGRDWALPYVDWFLGIAGPASWGFQKGIGGTDAAGGMDDRAVDITQSHYAEVAFSLARRAPLFELVYHGACRATHWWGDQPLIMPDVWDKRDLVHLLLDDMEVFRVYNQYARSMFWLNLDRVAETCKLLGAWGKAVGYDRIVDYRVLNETGTAARATYSGGLSMAVNLGDAPATMPEGTALPPRCYLITGRAKRMPALPVGKPTAIAPDWQLLDGYFDVKATGCLSGWSAGQGMRLEADTVRFAPDRIGGARPELPLASARLSGAPPASGVVLESRPFRVLGGWAYSLGAWVRADTPCQVVFGLVADDGAEALSKPVSAGPEWAPVGWSGVVPPRSTTARLFVKLVGATGAVDLNVDDFRVDARPPAPPLQLPFRAVFEKDAMGWSGTSGVRCAWTADAGREGPGAIHVTGRNEGQWSLAAGAAFRLAPGTRVRLSGWMRVDRYDPAGKPPFLKCELSRVAGGHIRNELTSRYDLGKPGTWQRLEGVFTVPDEPVVCWLAMEKGGTHAATADLYLDDVAIEKVP